MNLINNIILTTIMEKIKLQYVYPEVFYYEKGKPIMVIIDEDYIMLL